MEESYTEVHLWACVFGAEDTGPLLKDAFTKVCEQGQQGTLKMSVDYSSLAMLSVA